MRKRLALNRLTALVYLDCGGAGRQGEVEAVHQSRLVHAGEPPERGLRLAGAGLRFDDDEPPVERRVARGLLYRVGRAVYVEQIPEFGRSLEAVSLSGQVQPYRVDGLLGPLPRSLDIVVLGRINVSEPFFVRADPVGPVTQAQEHVLEGGSARQRRRARCERGGEPQAQQPADATHAVLGVQVVEPPPDGRVLVTRAAFQLQRPAVMRERGYQHRADRLAVAVVPS